MILLTGATGLVGRYLTFLLLENGYEIRAMVRKEEDIASFKEHKNLTFHIADLSDYISLRKATLNIETVINTAGIVSFNHSAKNELYKVNVEGTANLVNVLLEKDSLNRLIHFSSIAAIGRDITNRIVDEKTKWTNSELNSEYAISKYLGELEVWRGIEEGLNAVILNPSIILGRSKDWSAGSSYLFHLASTSNFYPESSFNYIDIRDVGNTVLKSLRNEQCLGERYILTAGEVSYKTFFNKVRDILQIEKHANAVSLSKLKPFAMAGDFLQKNFGLNTSLNKYIYNNLKNRFSYRTEKVFSLLSKDFHTLDETLKFCLIENVENKTR